MYTAREIEAIAAVKAAQDALNAALVACTSAGFGETYVIEPLHLCKGDVDKVLMDIWPQSDEDAARVNALHEPEMYQYRTKPEWDNHWRSWKECSKGEFDDFVKTPLLNDWQYETRTLHLARTCASLDIARWLANGPAAMRHSFDGDGYLYIDNGSGSDWQTRIKDAEPLYAPPDAARLTATPPKDE